MTLTLIMPFYENAGMLALQYAGWAAWPQKLKDRMSVIIVDDGSPSPAVDVERPAGLPTLSIYRVMEDRPWHQHGARNLGAHVAGEGWLLLTDMDHVLTVNAAASLLKRIDMGKLSTGAVYMLDRVEADTGLPTRAADGKPKPHPNSFVLTRDLYWRIGGYDEDYCGVYGTDGLFRSRAFTIGVRGHLKHVTLTRYWRDLVPDASTTSLERKSGREPNAKQTVKIRKAEPRANVSE